ncbi:MAG TPA: amidohydrolase family protein [Alphaproteobacteria bacterium]|nr:amidohydrolase family protein [Alphaproteobacteria bacterium]
MTPGAEPIETIALDVHAHLVPIIPERLARINGVVWRAADETLTVDGHALGIQNLFRPAALVAWMDKHRIERAWISVPPPTYRPKLDAARAREWVGYLNDGLAAICAAHSGRLAPLHHLPIEHPALAAELAAALIANDARGFSAAAGSMSICLSDTALDPLWAQLDARDGFLFLHPGACCDGRLKAFYLENLLGNPYETSVAAAHLVFGGVCERFPRIRFCLAHGGGATAIVAGRLQQGYDSKRPGVDLRLAPPRQALRRFMVDSILHDAKLAELAANVFGETNILFGSDWPFPMGLLDPHAQLGAFAPALRRAICRGNADRLLAELETRIPRSAERRE